LFGVANYVQIGKRDFKPVELKNHTQDINLGYLDGPVEYRFNLLPKQKLLERISGRSSVIDLSFTNPHYNFR
jgi:hypothetical protein